MGRSALSAWATPLQDVAGDLFKKQELGPQCRNEFVLRVQPDPSIYMKLTVKDPGMRLAIAQVQPSSSSGLPSTLLAAFPPS